MKFDASTPSEAAVAIKSNFIEFGSAHEWSGIWTGPQIRTWKRLILAASTARALGKGPMFLKEEER